MYLFVRHVEKGYSVAVMHEAWLVMHDALPVMHEAWLVMHDT
jgi:hypothetical protein